MSLIIAILIMFEKYANNIRLYHYRQVKAQLFFSEEVKCAGILAARELCIKGLQVSRCNKWAKY